MNAEKSDYDRSRTKSGTSSQVDRIDSIEKQLDEQSKVDELVVVFVEAITKPVISQNSVNESLA